MKTSPSLSGGIDRVFAAVLGLIAVGVVLLGWEWHSAHPKKHPREQPTPSAVQPEANTTDEKATGPETAGATTPTPPAATGGSKKHHKHGH